MAEITIADQERVAANLRELVAGVEDLLTALRKEGGERYRDATARIEHDVVRARELLDEMQDSVASRARAVARRTDRIVREHPWETAGASATVAILLGVAIGLLVARSLSQGID
jgi:ElaB/YqjD/DUF883 family membrane-anchored ribosome-binding protein